MHTLLATLDDQAICYQETEDLNGTFTYKRAKITSFSKSKEKRVEEVRVLKTSPQVKAT